MWRASHLMTLAVAAAALAAVTAVGSCPGSRCTAAAPIGRHRRLLPDPVDGTAVAVATSVVDGTGEASATAKAVATVNTLPGADSQSWNASVCLWASGNCALNPAYLFSLPTPSLGAERLLLQITAMRYACLNHTDATACASDTSNWCNYKEDSSQCRLQYDDADFVGMLLWSVTSIACKGSRLAEVVACSMYVAQKDCTAAACEWAEQACYPPWYSGMIDDVNLLADLKKQVHAAAPEVWGDCEGAQLYKRYAAACDYPDQDSCAGDTRCGWISEYDAEVGPNPLNFTKQCVLRTTSSPVETVYLGPGTLTGDTLAAQKACATHSANAECTAGVVNIAADKLTQALAFAAGQEPSNPEDAAFAASDLEATIILDDTSPVTAIEGSDPPLRVVTPPLQQQAASQQALQPLQPLGPIVWAPAWVRPAGSKPPPAPTPVPAPAPRPAAASGCRAHVACSRVQLSLWKLRVLPLPPLS